MEEEVSVVRRCYGESRRVLSRPYRSRRSAQKVARGDAALPRCNRLSFKYFHRLAWRKKRIDRRAEVRDFGIITSVRGDTRKYRLLDWIISNLSTDERGFISTKAMYNEGSGMSIPYDSWSLCVYKASAFWMPSLGAIESIAVGILFPT